MKLYQNTIGHLLIFILCSFINAWNVDLVKLKKKFLTVAAQRCLAYRIYKHCYSSEYCRVSLFNQMLF
jgi:hypothetical protein